MTRTLMPFETQVDRLFSDAVRYLGHQTRECVSRATRGKTRIISLPSPNGRTSNLGGFPFNRDDGTRVRREA